jgi:hypothetical protein
MVKESKPLLLSMVEKMEEMMLIQQMEELNSKESTSRSFLIE